MSELEGSRPVPDDLPLPEVGDETGDVGGGAGLVDPIALDQGRHELIFAARLLQELPQHTTAAIQLQVHRAVEIEDDDIVASDVPREILLSKLHDPLPSLRAGPAARPPDPSTIPPVNTASLYVMTPTEIAWGYPLGSVGPLAPPGDGGHTTPREALEQVIRTALLQPPCGIAFSGGRDSSTILAVATEVARRDGLPEPVALTRVFPDVPSTEESEWQEMVVRHLDVRDWQRLPIGDELDLLGPIATARLRDHGVVWPPTIHSDAHLVELLEGGSLLDGEGGDEVLGVSDHRVAPLTFLTRAPRPLRWSRIRSALGALSPYAVRMRHARRRYDGWPLPWLRTEAREALLTALSEFRASQPLAFRSSVRAVPGRRAQALLLRNRKLLAAAKRVSFESPLLHPDVVHALARDGGWLGRGDRADVLGALVPDLLPAAVIERRTKAEFGGTFMSHHTREFASSWTGAGVDPSLVDPDELRRMWLQGDRNALTSALLQAAWLGDHSSRSAGSELG